MRNLIRDDQIFYSRLDFVRQLEAVVRKEFDAIVLLRVMRSGNHDTGIGSEAPR